MIHYHGLPITGADQPILAMRGKHCMISYAHKSQINTALDLCQSITIDNGAFSSWKSGKEFDFDGFAEFAEKYALHPSVDFYLMPDVIDGDHHDNQRMRAKWFNAVGRRVWRKGVPVWHLHEPLEILRDFVLGNYPAVALGSSGEFAEVGTKQWWNRMAEAMDVACDKNGFPYSKLHGLRMLDPRIFSKLPLSSADSTNVAQNVGIDSAWQGAYAPPSRKMRAMVMMDRIESHNSSPRWESQLTIQANLI